MNIKPKFAKVSLEARAAIMDEYLAGDITQRELGLKHNFSYRQLAVWFKEAGRSAEYQAINKANRHKVATAPITDHARLKISGINSIYWEGRKLEIKSGSISGVLRPAPNHPNKNSQGYVYEHRLVMEEQLGRFLESHEIVHHIDLDPLNNHPTNLLLLNGASEHGKLHLCLQLALVKLMAHADLRNLTTYLLDAIRSDAGWTLGKSKTERRKGALTC